jgi:hypothetical protein
MATLPADESGQRELVESDRAKGERPSDPT